jgi:uncharacterized protein (DUF2141 family)
MSKIAGLAAVALFVAPALAPAAAIAGQEIANDLDRCARGEGPAMLVSVTGFAASSGNVRVQSYPASKDEWLQKGRWTTRIDQPVRAADGTMRFCLGVPRPGVYGVAVRHDRNGNGKTDLTSDGGGFSNNPKLTLFNLGKPGADKVAVRVGTGVTPVSIKLQYW